MVSTSCSLLCGGVAVLVFHVLLAAAQYRFSVRPVTLNQGAVPSPRSQHVTIVVNTRNGFFILVHGGRDERGGKADTWYYHVNTNRWRLLIPLSTRILNDPPPPMYGAVGGYRFVQGFTDAFLYVTLGTEDGHSTFHNDMWAMDLRTFTWKRVKLDGDIPEARYAAAGALKRFAKNDGSVRPELIISHGFGKHGPLSDTYKCIFNETDPYHATWVRLHGPVNQYAPRQPHGMYLQGSTFTAKRDMVLFGGCYSSKFSGGYCPSQHVWHLQYLQEETESVGETTESGKNATAEKLVPGTESASWRQLARGPTPRLGAAMAQALNSFNGAYSEWATMAVVYSGAHYSDDLNIRQVMSAAPVTNGEVAMLSTKTGVWMREVVNYTGPPQLKERTLMGRRGASMSIVRDTTEKSPQPDVPNEFYLLFGGLLENGTFTNELLRLSFDAFAVSHRIGGSVHWSARPQVHGVLMFLSFGALMVAGVMWSRYFRGQQKKLRTATVHIFIQAMALIFGWAGVGVGMYSRHGSVASFAHASMGLFLMLCASLQPVNVVVGVTLRWRSEKRRMSAGAPSAFVASHRSTHAPWKILHRLFGVLILILGFVNITLGLFLIAAPLLLWIHWLVYSILLATVTLWMELTATRKAAQDSNPYDVFEQGNRRENSALDDSRSTGTRGESISYVPFGT